MAADGSAAIRAAPRLFLLVEESVHPLLFDSTKVFNHTHVVLFAVPFVERFEPLAGEVPALKAETHKPFAHLFAAAVHKGAVLAARHTAGAVSFGKALFVEVVLHRQVTDT